VELVRATTAHDNVAACIIQGMLETAGIPVMLRLADSGAGLEFPATMGGPGPVDVLVPADRLDEARRLIDEGPD
jgi:hypothetical protein